MVTKKEKTILERIEQDIKEIKEMLKPKDKRLDGEKEPATESQVWRLKQMGKFKEDLSKQEAFQIIKQHKEGK